MTQLIPLFFFLFIFWSHSSEAKSTLSFNNLMIKMMNSNDSLLKGAALKEQAKIEDRNSYRLNIPSLTGELRENKNDLSQTSVTTTETSQEIQTYNLGLGGALPRYGMSYELSYLKQNQEQEAFSFSPTITKAGDTITGKLSFDLLEDAGYLVGNIPFNLRKAQHSSSKANYDMTLQAAIKDLVSLYLVVTSIQEKIDVISDIQKDAIRLNNNYKSLYAEGKVSKVDLLSSDIQLNQQKSSLLELNIALRESKRKLFYYVGGYDQRDLKEELRFQPFSFRFKKINKKIDNLPASNPELVTLDMQKKINDLEVNSLNNKLLPTLKFSVGYVDSNNPYSDSLITTDQSQFGSMFVGLNLSIPLDNVGADTDLIRKKIERTNLEKRKKLLTNSNYLKIQGLQSEIQRLESQIDITRSIELLSKKRFKATLPLVKRNSSARIDIFNFQNQLISTQYSLIDSNVALIRKQVEILYTKGLLSKSFPFN